MIVPKNPVNKYDAPVNIDMRNLGSSGLREFGGQIYDETLRALSGRRAVEVYREMSDNDPTCGAIMYTIDKLCRAVPWRVTPASSRGFDQRAADFVESCMHDMEMTWIDTISEALTMLIYGYSVHEIVYKRRAGSGTLEPSLHSKYADGRVGWRGIPMRSQDTVWKWLFDRNGNTIGLVQQAPPDYNFVTLPMEKCLLFRTSVFKNNPEGRSIFRSAYRDWYLKKNIENIECIGIERDLAGLPTAWLPPSFLSSTASTDEKAILAEMQNIVTNIRRDEQEGVVMPLMYDDKGNKMFDLTLMTSGGARNFDTDKIIQRHDVAIARTCLADFLMLGHGANSSGSWAMHSDKTALFAVAIGAFLDIICNTFNRFAVPRLMAFNAFPMSEHPRIEHGDIANVNLQELGDFITKITQAGMPLFPDEGVESYLRKAANLPDIVSGSADKDQRIEPSPSVVPTDVRQVSDQKLPSTDEQTVSDATAAPATIVGA